MTNVIISNAIDPIATFVFAHGAGADMNHEFMTQVSQLLVKHHISVFGFNFPYMIKRQLTGKRYPPDRMPKLLTAYQQILTNIDNVMSSNVPLFIGGKSMGGRVAATLSAQINNNLPQLSGLICLGYPFHPQNKPDTLRLEPLQKCLLPTLIVQGERDALGDRQAIAGYDLPKNCQINFLEDGDHSFKPRVKSGFSQQQHINTAVQHIVKFIHVNK